MSKGAASPPAAPDPSQTAAAQSQSNIATAQSQAALNNANVYSPYGSSVWTPTTNAQGQTTYTLNQTLSPQMAQLFGGQVGLAQQLAGLGGTVAGSGGGLTGAGQSLLGNIAGVAGQIPTTLNLGGVPGITQLTPQSFRTNVAQGPVQGSVNANLPQLVQQAQNAAYKAQTQYLDPQWSQAESNQRQQLADQGIEEGTPAFSRAMLDFNNQKQQAYQQAQDQAVAAGNAQQQALFGESLSAGQFANQAQQQVFGQGLQLADLYNQAVLGAAGQQNTATGLGLSEAQAQAAQPINALQALLGAGTGLYSAGLGGIGTGAGLVNAAPTWPISIPTMGGTPTTVEPTSYSGIQQAASFENSIANRAATQNIQGLTNTVGPALFGPGGFSNLLPQGGLFGAMAGLFNPGAAAAAPEALATMGLSAGTSVNALTDAVMAAAL